MADVWRSVRLPDLATHVAEQFHQWPGFAGVLLVHRPKKIVLVAVILLAGGVLAFQFRRPVASRTDGTQSESQTGQQSEPAAGAVLAGRIEPAGTSANRSDTTESSPPAGENALHDRSPVAVPAVTVATVETTGISEPAAAHSPPASGPPAASNPPEFSRNFTDGNPKTSSAAGSETSRLIAPAIQDSGLQGPLGGEAAEATHTVADGDTLAQLAQKYLGSASRAAELFAYNRDVLSDPELLPIGAELRIPNGPAPSAPRTLGQTVGQPMNASPAVIGTGSTNSLGAMPAAIPASEAAAPLVPVPATSAYPPAGAEPGKLVPLPPTHLAAIPIDHSYVVQPGDTLWAIAQRLYGDGRRSDVLLQANHDRLWNPNNLRPGMTLVVP